MKLNRWIRCGGNRMKKEKSCSVTISRQEHGISRKLMNPNALRILYRLRDNGFVGYLFGISNLIRLKKR